MKKSIRNCIFAGSILLTAVSCQKKQEWEFVGTPAKEQVMLLNGMPTDEKVETIIQEKEEIEEGEILNPWASEKLSGDSSAKAENGEYDRPQEINIETFKHLVRMTVQEIGNGIELAFNEGNENPWVTKITRDDKILFASVPKDSNYNSSYKTVVKVEGIRGLRIPGDEKSPDLLELIDDTNGNLKEVVIIPKGLPELKANKEYKCFEFGEKEKYGLAVGQLYIFPNPETQKEQNMGMIRFNTEEYLEPATYSTTNEILAQRSEVMILAKTSEKIDFEGKTSYWFQAKRGDKTFWIPGYNLYLQTGTYNRLNQNTDVIYLPTHTDCWYRLTDDYKDPKGVLKAGQIVYVSGISTNSYEKESRVSKYYRTIYPASSEVFGIYLEKIDDLHGIYDLYADAAGRTVNYPAVNDPEVIIYEAPNTRYKILGKKYNESTMPADTDVYTIAVDGYTDIQDVVNNVYGKWYSVNTPVKGFIFVEQPNDY